jgi:predicted outer membrane repeat protein
LAIVSANDTDDSINTVQSTSDNLNSISSDAGSPGMNENSVNQEKHSSSNNSISINKEGTDVDVKGMGETMGFTKLQQEIDKTSPSGILYLNNDYEADLFRSKININKSITIYGNGHTLDANYIDKILYLNLKKNDVVKLYDLKLIDGLNGGEISTYGGNVYLHGCLIQDRTDDKKFSRKSSSIYSTESNLYLTDSTIIFTNSAININYGACGVDSCNFIGDNKNKGAKSMVDRTISVNSNDSSLKVSNSVFYNTVQTVKYDIFSERSESFANDNWWGSNKNVKPNTKGQVHVDTWKYLDVNKNVVEIGDTVPVSLCLKSNKDGSILSNSFNYIISNVSATNATIYQRGNTIFYTPTKGNSGTIRLTFTYCNVSTVMNFKINHIERNITVNNYDELATVLDNVQQAYIADCVINLAPGDYNATRNIKMSNSNSIRRIIINGNNNVIDGKNRYNFMDVQGIHKPINGLHLTIANTTFQNFKTDEGRGSVINMNMTSGELNIENSIFNNNTAKNGGAIEVTQLNTINIVNSEFNSNTAKNNGGAIEIYSSQKVNIFNSTFVENQARAGGAAYIIAKKTDIRNSNFVSNKAAYGGAINYISEVTISDSQFLNNFASENAGAIYRTGKLTINNVTFFNNLPQDYEYTGDATDYVVDSEKNYRTHFTFSKKQVKTMDMKIVTSNNEQIQIKNNQLTLGILNQIFHMDFRNGQLLVYIDGKLVFNATTANDLTQLIYDLLNVLSGNHEIKVEFTDKDGNTNNYTETITVYH